MFNFIIISCIFFTLLCICKIAFSLTELITWKRKLEKERQLKNEQEQLNIQKQIQEQLANEQKILETLKTLSKKEIMIMKYLWRRSEHIAFFPSDNIQIKTLCKKKCITQLTGIHKELEKIINITQSTDGLAFYINKTVLGIMEKYQDEIKHLWHKVRINTIYDMFQD